MFHKYYISLVFLQILTEEALVSLECQHKQLRQFVVLSLLHLCYSALSAYGSEEGLSFDIRAIGIHSIYLALMSAIISLG